MKERAFPQRGERSMNKKNKISRKVWAFLLAFVMLVSLLPSNLKAVQAEVISSYPVTVKFFDYDGTTPATDYPSSGQYYILATLTWKNDSTDDPVHTAGDVAGYGFVTLNNGFTSAEATYNIDHFFVKDA